MVQFSMMICVVWHGMHKELRDRDGLIATGGSAYARNRRDMRVYAEVVKATDSAANRTRSFSSRKRSACTAVSSTTHTYS